MWDWPISHDRIENGTRNIVFVSRRRSYEILGITTYAHKLCQVFISTPAYIRIHKSRKGFVNVTSEHWTSKRTEWIIYLSKVLNISLIPFRFKLAPSLLTNGVKEGERSFRRICFEEMEVCQSTFIFKRSTFSIRLTEARMCVSVRKVDKVPAGLEVVLLTLIPWNVLECSSFNRNYFELY